MYDAFIDVIASKGGAVVTGARVDASRGSATGGSSRPSTDGERYEGDAFVCTLPPQDAPAIAAEGSPLAAELRAVAGARRTSARSASTSASSRGCGTT